jgi:Glyoxalase-like domain
VRTAVAALDHLVLATPNLAATSAWITEATGVVPSAGGQHIHLGTRNTLCSLGPTSYLEIVGPDPEQPDPPMARPFGIDALNEATFVAWAIAVADIDEAIRAAQADGFDPGEPFAMQRRRPDGLILSWRLTMPMTTTVPFLIDWLDSPHPAADSAPGLELVSLRARHPLPRELEPKLAALDVTMAIAEGPEALLVEISAGGGSRTLTSFDTGT